MTHVLVATDGSVAARAALRSASTLLKSLTLTRMTVLSVVEPARSALLHADALAIPQNAWDALADAANESAVSELEAARAELEELDVRVTLIHRYGQRVHLIVEAASELSADVILFGTSGWRGLRGLLGLSATGAIVSRAPCPVLVIRT